MIIDFCTDNTWPQVQIGYGVLILKEKYIPFQKETARFHGLFL
jgi:hypothetical protein